MGKKMVYNQTHEHADKDAVLDAVSCVDAAELLNLKMDTRKGRIYVSCPFHQKRLGKLDQHLGNAVIIDSGKRCRCYACGGSGDAIAMVMAYQSLSFCDATDWLASRKAPELLSEEWKESSGHVKICPYTKDQFNVIGIHTEDFIVPVGIAFSKCEASKILKSTKNSASFTNIVYPDEFGSGHEGNGVLLCRKERFSITDIYRDDIQVFYFVIKPKAILAYKKYTGMLNEVKKDLPECQIKNLMIDELLTKIKIAKKFINDAEKY